MCYYNINDSLQVINNMNEKIYKLDCFWEPFASELERAGRLASLTKGGRPLETSAF